MQFSHIYPVWALIALGLSDSNLFSDDLYADDPDSSTFPTDDVGDFIPTEPISDNSALTDSNFLAESPDHCLPALPPASKIRRAQSAVCDNLPDGSTETETSATAEDIQKYWCGSSTLGKFGNFAVCNVEDGEKMSSQHFLNKFEGYDISRSFYETLFRCTLSKTYLRYFAPIYELTKKEATDCG